MTGCPECERLCAKVKRLDAVLRKRAPKLFPIQADTIADHLGTLVDTLDSVAKAIDGLPIFDIGDGLKDISLSLDGMAKDVAAALSGIADALGTGAEEVRGGLGGLAEAIPEK